MPERILITGGAGFIGSHVADLLLAEGYRVRALDNLSTQVHGPGARRPSYLDPAVELLPGDLRDPKAVRTALKDVDAVFHFASAVGVGQSMYEIDAYTAVNNLGTAILLQALAEQPVARLIVASSMSVYGEGLYRSPDGGLHAPERRRTGQLLEGEWELRDAAGQALEPVATPETKPAAPSSVYALSKLDQERLCLMIGEAYDIPTVALRFFNVYGPRQALENPYTGVMAIFATRYLNGHSPMIFEDGRQRRDFVYVSDVAQACLLALERDGAAGGTYNIGSGESHTVAEIAERLGRRLDTPEIPPTVTGDYRVGDIRHCFADIGAAREHLDYRPRIRLDDGLGDLTEWLRSQSARDRYEEANLELGRRGLRL